MKRFCPVCESDKKIVFKEVDIQVGKEVFPAKTDVCEKCGYIALTPKVRKEMDAWGQGLNRSIVEYQPMFTETVHHYLDEVALRYSIQKTPLIKAFLAFFLKDVVNSKDFEFLKELMRKQDTHKFTVDGSKRKISVGFNYLGYKEINLFSEVWSISAAKAIEEAVHFCIGLLEYGKDVSRLRVIAEQLDSLLKKTALAS